LCIAIRIITGINGTNRLNFAFPEEMYPNQYIENKMNVIVNEASTGIL
jgi:hypothetical protein